MGAPYSNLNMVKTQKYAFFGNFIGTRAHPDSYFIYFAYLHDVGLTKSRLKD